jgi:hypothetical protein
VDGDNGVQAVVLARQKRRELQAVDLRGERVELGADFRGDVLPLAPQLEVGVEVGELSRQAVVRLDLLFQALALGKDGLGRFGVLPEVGPGYLLLDRCELTAAGRRVKENSAVRQCASSVGQIRGSVLQS